MSTRTSPWPNGVPSWADLATPDMTAASAFYTAVLGWEMSGGSEEYGGYVIALESGRAAAGLAPQGEGMPNAWTLYFASDDAEGTAQAITDAGGTVLMPVTDVGPMGRMLIASDPSGAAFGIWQAGQMIGASVVNEPGGMVWEDLRSTDPAAAQAFYRSVFGYRVEPVEMAPPDYGTFALPGEQAPLGGMGPMMGAPDGAPSHWLVYFAVADTDAAVTSAQATGGTVLAPAFDSPYGRMAVLQDPTGAAFCVMAIPPGQPMPDRAG